MKNPLYKNDDRRSGIDRRQFSYIVHIPEQRYVKDRRCVFNRKRERYSRMVDMDHRRISQYHDFKLCNINLKEVN
jgi:hypothetical protein